MAPAKLAALTLCLLGILFWQHDSSQVAHWSYSGEAGPEHWGELSRENSACKAGHEQSPIDIQTAERGSPQPIQFDYQPSPLNIVNNGHSIQVNYSPGSKISVGGTDYEVVQFHFHQPSEEEVQGRRYDMVMHIVHKDNEGHLAVVAVLMNTGRENAALQQVWNHLPASPGDQYEIGDISVNLSSLLPGPKGYYTFDGSLTTPPCTEGVRWFVLKTPVQLSGAQLAAFSRLYPDTARPIQPTNGRKIEEH
ncbi:MAG TPA: carbonic anhydrase family protein [Candidatus Angelobacter sp.]|jgi:carbonic anhydrase|nr:carbonic anhydrase family protein [Candidatus Angelobacter sp.]